MARKRPALLAVFIISLVSAGGSLRAADRPYLEAAEKAAAWIRSSEIKTPEGLVWPADPKDPDSVNTTLYAGTPGVVLFFLQAYASMGNIEYLREARGGADALLPAVSKEKGMGLYEGLSGILFALEETHKATGDRKYRQAFLGGLERIRAGAVPKGAGVEWSAVTDIISGSAGTGLFLIYAFHETRDAAWLDLATWAGARLIELGKPENGGLKWAMDPEYPRLMPNFSHGTAGIAYFLARLYQETKRREFLDAALAGAKYLLSVASTEGETCLVFHHEPNGKDLYYLGWCHGPVGTARLFYALSEATGDKTWLGWVRKSARALLGSGIPERETPGFWNNDGICCGLAGVGEFFLDLGRTLGDKSYLEFCDRVTARLLAKASVDDGLMSWLQAEHRVRPDFLVAQTGYMQGAAGIGTFLLRLDAAGRGRKRVFVFPDSPFGEEPAKPAGGDPEARPGPRRDLVSIAELLGPADPLAAQDLRFDSRFAVEALAFLDSGDEKALDRIARLPAALHLLNHARNFENSDVPTDSARSLVASLLEPRVERAKQAPVCARSLAFFIGPLLDDPRWLNDVLAYLPPGFRFHGSLFLTFGYDIGVAFPPNASLNGAAPHFDGHPRELLYYAIHELHHAGFMSLHPPPRFSGVKTCRELLGVVEYLTELEGTAVFAAADRRRLEGALSDDPDYVALQDEDRMKRDEVLYFREYDRLASRGTQPAAKEDWAVLDKMSSGERLWYRVGARMAARIERELGRPALVSLIREGPRRFFEAYQVYRSEPSPR
jgi:rhamnogalacturonyl hydrolase YesR